MSAFHCYVNINIDVQNEVNIFKQIAINNGYKRERIQAYSVNIDPDIKYYSTPFLMKDYAAVKFTFYQL